MYDNISLFLELENMVIKKSNNCKLYLFSSLIKLESWQPQSILGFGEYRNLNDLATDIGI